MKTQSPWRLVVRQSCRLLFGILAAVLVASPALAARPVPYWQNGAVAGEVKFLPAPWPADGAWNVYTNDNYETDPDIDDPRTQDPSHGGARPQSYVNVSSGCPDKSQASVYYYYDSVRKVIFFRWRVEDAPNNYGTGPAPGVYGSTNPWNSGQWTVLFDLDGDGFRDFAVHLNGSSGDPANPVDVLNSLWSATKTQSVDYEGDPTNIIKLAYNPTGFVSSTTQQILQFDGSGAPSAVQWPNGASETYWDYGTTRAINISTSTCKEFIVDYQIPLAMLDASSVGGPALTETQPFAFIFATANSLNDPFQKDVVYEGSYVCPPTAPAPFGDPLTLSGGVIAQPISTKVTSAAAELIGGACPIPLIGQILDTLYVDNCQATYTLTSAKFIYWYDVDGNGLPDEAGGAWFDIPSTLTGTTLTATWDVKNVVQGQYLVAMELTDQNTPQHITRTYLSVTAAPYYTNLPTPGMGAATKGINWTSVTVGGACGTVPPTMTKVASPAPPASVAGGGTATFTLTIANVATSSIGVSQINDALPPGFAFAALDTASSTLDDGVTVTPPTPGATGTVTFTFSPTAAVPTGSRTLVYTATAGQTSGTFYNTATAVTSVGNISASDDVLVKAARMAITKSASLQASPTVPQTSFAQNDIVRFTMTYYNPSPTDVTNVVITDPLPLGFTYVGASPAPASAPSVGANGTVTWNIGTVLANSAPMTVYVDATATAAAAGAHTNTATLTSDNAATVNASVNVKVSGPVLAISKVANRNTVTTGNTIAYTIEYTNTGDANATLTTLTDTAPTGFTFTSSSPVGCTAGTTVFSASVVSGGSGYATAPTVGFTGGGGTGAAATATVSGGVVTLITITAPGSGYTTAPSITLTGGGGTGATAVANLLVTCAGVAGTLAPGVTGTYVLNFNVVAGALDPSVNTATINASNANSASTTYSVTPYSTACTNSTFYFHNATTNVSTGGAGVLRVVMSSNGTGYTTAPTVGFTPVGAAPTIAAAGTALASNGLTRGVNMTTYGQGYSAAPTVSFTGGGGTGAAGTAELTSAARYADTTSGAGAGTGVPASPAVFTVGGAMQTIAEFFQDPADATSSYVISAPTVKLGWDRVSGNRIKATVNIYDFNPADNSRTLIATANNGTGAGGGGTPQLNIIDTNYTFPVVNYTLRAGRRLLWEIQAADGNGNSATTGRLLIDGDATSGGNTGSYQTYGVVCRVKMYQSLTKSADKLAVNPAGVAPANQVVYTLTYTNPNSVALTGVTISDPLPTGLTYVSATGSPTANPGVGNNGTVTWTIGTLAAGATASVTVTAQIVSSYALSTFTNTATMSSNEVPSVNASITTNVVRPNVQIAKRASATTLTLPPAQNFTYTIDVSNIGNATATNIVMSDPLPTGISQTTYTNGTGTVALVTVTTPGSGYVSAPTVSFSGGGGTGAAATAVISGGAVVAVRVTNGGTGYASAPSVSFSSGAAAATASTATVGVSGQTLTFTLASMPANSTASYTIPVSISSTVEAGTAVVTNTASVTDDSNLTPRTASADVTITSNPVLTLSEVATPSAVRVNYVDVTNGGSGYATAPTVDFSAAGCTTPPTGYASIFNGVVTGVTITSPGSGCTSGTFAVTFSGGGGSGAAATTTTGPGAGDTITYVLTISNTGSARATGVVVYDNIPNYSSFASSPDGTFTLGRVSETVGNLDAGASTTTTYTVTVTDALPKGSTALTTSGGATSSNAPAPAGVTTTLYTGAAPAYAIAKSPSGITEPYPIAEIYATGTTDANYLGSITVNAGGTGYTSAPTVSFSGGGGSGAEAVALISGGSVIGIQIVNRGTGYTSAPTVSFSGGGGAGATATAILAASISVKSSTLATVGNYVAIYDTGIAQYVVLQVLAKTGSTVTLTAPVTAPADALVYPALEYALSYSNTGKATGTTVTVTDTLPSNLRYGGYPVGFLAPLSTPGIGSSGTITWSVGTLAYGASGTLKYYAFATGSGSYTNTAYISDGTTFTPDSYNATASATNTFGALIPSKSTSTPTVTNFAVGVTPRPVATYTIYVKNPLTSAATAVTVTDNLAVGFTYKSGTTKIDGVAAADPGGTSTTPVWSGLTIAAGATLAIEFSAEISDNVPNGTYQNEIIVGGPTRSLEFDHLATTDEDVKVCNPAPAIVAPTGCAGVSTSASIEFLPGATYTWSITSGNGTITNLSTGTVHKISIGSGGTGYTTATVSITGGGGTGAAANATISGGVITAITMTSVGSGYTSVPTVTITGDGAGATAAAVLGTGIVYMPNGSPVNLSVQVIRDGCTTTSTAAASMTTAPVITSPAGASVCDLGTATFTASASNANTYQWQVSTNGGGSWSNATGAPYSGDTTLTLTINPATVAMNGYLYRIVASNASCTQTSASSTLTVTSGGSCSQPDLTVTISDSPDPVYAGNQITYTEYVQNVGPNPSTGLITFTQSTPAGTTFQSMTPPSGWSCTTPAIGGTGAITCTTNNVIAANSSSPAFTLVLNTDTTLAHNSTITLSGTISGGNDGNATNNTASAITTVWRIVDAAIVKTSNATNATYGAGYLYLGNPPTATAFAYSMVVTNNGPSVATNATVSDTLPSEVVYVSNSTTVGTCTYTAETHSLSCSLGTLAVGASATITVNVTVAIDGVTFTNTGTVGVTETESNLANNSSSTAVSTLAPTLVEMREMKATQTKNGVTVAWHTSLEVDNLGFNVYRRVNGQPPVKLNAQLIAGSALFTRRKTTGVSGYGYRFKDNPPAGSLEYWIEDIDLKGRKTLNGPVLPVPGTDEVSSDAPTEPDPGIGSLGGVIASPRGFGVVPTGRTAPLVQRQNQQEQIAAQKAGKVVVAQAGWVRVSKSDLVAGGYDPGTNSRALAVFADGIEVPVEVNDGGDGRFDASDTIEFFGSGADTPTAGTRVYYVVNDKGTGARVNSSNGAKKGTAAPTSFQYSHSLKERFVFFPALIVNGEDDNFFGSFISSWPAAASFPVENFDASGSTAEIEIVLQGGPDTGNHDLSIRLNGNELGPVRFPGSSRVAFKRSVPVSWLVEGDNQLVYVEQNGSWDLTAVESLKVVYPHRFRADDGALMFTVASGSAVTVDGFKSDKVKAVDLTNEYQPLRLQVSMSAAADGSRAASLVSPEGATPRTILIYDEARVVAPAQVVANQPSTLSSTKNAADLVIVAHRDFLAAANALKKARDAEGISTTVVDVQNVYDEFAFGEHGPQAIRSFFERTQKWSRVPKYAILFGDSSFDPRNYMGFGTLDFVPTKLAATGYLKTATDDWFADFANTGLPAIAIGRIPVRTAAEAADVVDKLVRRTSIAQTEPWLAAVDVINDVPTVGAPFERSVAAILPTIPQSLTTHRLDFGSSTDPFGAITDAFNRGSLLMTYVGHGSVDIWGRGIFGAWDAASLRNGDRLPFVVAMNCLNGYFHDLYQETMAEALLKNRQGGAIGVLAGSALTSPDHQTQMAAEFNRQVFAGARVGDAVLKAKAATPDADTRKSFILFGDPTLKLR